jgi:hypothetical protein
VSASLLRMVLIDLQMYDGRMKTMWNWVSQPSLDRQTTKNKQRIECPIWLRRCSSPRISYTTTQKELFQPWLDPKCNIILIFYVRKPCMYICTAHVCSRLISTPIFWIMRIAKQQVTHPPHHPNDHGGHFGCRLQSTSTTTVRLNSSILVY